MIIRILLYVAIIPVFYLLDKIYKMDVEDQEPTNFIMSLLWSGVISALLAGFLEFVGELFLSSYLTSGSLTYYFWEFFAIVGCAEEGSKYLFLKEKTWNSYEFNYVFDGVIYGVTVSLGFALIENIEYVFSYGIVTGIVRAFMSIPGHAAFGVIMGAWYGLSKKYHQEGNAMKENLCAFLAFIVPMFIHGTYDLLLTIDTDISNILVLIVLAICYFILGKMSRDMARRDEHILGKK